jgi:hypothetical protein
LESLHRFVADERAFRGVAMNAATHVLKSSVSRLDGLSFQSFSLFFAMQAPKRIHLYLSRNIVNFFRYKSSEAKCFSKFVQPVKRKKFFQPQSFKF